MTTELSKPLFDIAPGLSLSEFNEIASSTRYLPRVQLFGSSSAIVKQRKFEAGHYGLATAKDQVEDLGEEFDCLPIQVRAKAMDISDRSKIINVFAKNSDAFKDIAERSKVQNSQCMYGPEFLIWLPTKSKFATMFFSNPTMRNVAPDMMQLLGRPATCMVRFIPSQQYGGWHGPIVTKCSTPFELPDNQQVIEQENAFSHPPKEEEVEVSEESAARER